MNKIQNIQTNSFVKGMNMDIDIHAIPENQYRYAENIRIITDTEGTSGVLQNIQNIHPVDGGGFISDDETVLYAVTVDKYAIILTVDSKNINRVYRVSDYNNLPLKNTVIIKGKLQYGKSNRVKIVANYEAENNIKIYITDGNTPIRVLNIMDNKYVYEPGVTNDLLDSEGNIKDLSILDLTPSSLLSPPKIVDLGSGNLQSGTVQYVYQLFNVRGSNTIMSPCSGLVHLTDSNTSSSLNEYHGLDKKVSTGKSVKMSIDLVDKTTGINYNSFYNNCRIFRIFYNDNTELPTVDVIAEIKSSSSATSIEYEDLGGAPINTITLEELNSLTNNSFVASTIEKKDNRLFAAGIKENTWRTDYDARAYRCTKEGRLILKSASGQNDIDVMLPEYGSAAWKNILSDIDPEHDCINPYNSVKGQPTANDNLQYSNKVERGARILGGSGINVSYRFVYTELTMDTMQSMNTSATEGHDYAKIQVLPQTTSSMTFYLLDGLKDTSINRSIPEYSRQMNYADPYIDANFRGYQRDEIYRFGIVFYNNKSIPSNVSWIGDIRMPNAHEYPTFFAGENLIGKALGLQFEVSNVPEGAVAYEIVRCRRTVDDRTVLMQGVISEITNYPYKYINKGDEPDNSYRPRIPLGYTDQDIPVKYTKAGRMTEIYAEQSSTFFNDRVTKYYVTFISPELDITGESLVGKLKNAHAELLYYLHPIASKGYWYRAANGANIYSNKYFITPNNTNWGFSSDRVTESKLIGCYNSDVNGFVIASEEFATEQTVHSISNLIGKRYILHNTAISESRLTVDINNNSIFPPIMAGGNIMAEKMQYYRTIGDINYLNLGHIHNSDGDNNGARRAGPFGYCAVLNGDFTKIPKFHRVDGVIQANYNITSVIGSQDIFLNKAWFELPVVNIKLSNIPYGGNSYIARTNSTYISTNSFTTIGPSGGQSLVYGGDTFIGVHDHRTANAFPDPGNGDYRASLISCTDYIPVESSINLALQYGETTSRSCEGMDDYTNPYLGTTIDGGTLGNYNKQTKPYYAYNDAYSVQGDAKKYVTESAYAITNANNINRIVYSQAKINNEVTDSWLQFKFADYLDVDNQYGKITNLKSFNDKLFFWQDSAFGIASVNDRSLITDNNISELTLGTGGILTRYDYITTGNGSSVINDNSITNSDFALYWHDRDKNELCQFSDTIHKLSKEKGVQTYLNANPNFVVHDSFYDNEFNEVRFCFNTKTLVYNEYTQSFTSFYTENPAGHLKFSDKLLYIKDNKVMQTEDRALNVMECKIQYIINKDILYTKTFDNVFFSGQFRDIKNMLTDATFRTTDQVGTITQDYVDGGYAIDHRENTYRFAIGREQNSDDTLSYPGRLRGKYLICDLTLNCGEQHNFTLPNINTTYRYSLV